MDAIPGQNMHDPTQVFLEHVQRLRTREWFRDAWIVLFVENNTGYEAGRLADVLRHVDNKHAAYVEPKNESHRRKLSRHNAASTRDPNRDLTAEYLRKADKEPGYKMTYNTKQKHRVDLRNALLQDRIFFYDEGVSGDIVQAASFSEAQRFARNKEKLQEQLFRCRVFARRGDYDTAPEKVYWSGKVNAEGKIQGGYNDDLAMILASGVSLWDDAMSGNLAGFPYDVVGMTGVRPTYSEL